MWVSDDKPRALRPAAVVALDGQRVGVGEQRAGLAGGGLAGVEDGHPGLGGVGRVRDQPVPGT